jgi:hypothetical protein
LDDIPQRRRVIKVLQYLKYCFGKENDGDEFTKCPFEEDNIPSNDSTFIILIRIKVL